VITEMTPAGAKGVAARVFLPVRVVSMIVSPLTDGQPRIGHRRLRRDH
jgi:hypothetical protein